LSAEQRDLLNKIDMSAHTATGMLNSFLDVSIIETGHLQPKKAPVDVGALLDRLNSVFSLSANQAAVDLRIVRTEIWVNSDTTILQTILQNIISNAIKYAPNGKVIAGVKRKDGQIWIEVHDQGAGFDKQHLPVNREASVLPQSAGLGLKIVEDLSAVLGIEFNLKSHLRKGTVARFGPFSIARRPEQLASNAAWKGLAGMTAIVDLIESDLKTSIIVDLERWGCTVLDGIKPAEGASVESIVITDSFRNLGESPVRQKAIIWLGSAEAEFSDVVGPVHMLSIPVERAKLRSVMMAIRANGA
jgi:anti-sigma regulatory factor (Ser/Thr protein kinase)